MENKDRLIHKLLNKSLSKEEAKAFENELTTNEEFVEEVGQIIAVEEGIKRLRAEQLEAIHQEYQTDIRKNWIWRGGVVAILLILLSLSYLIWSNSSNSDVTPTLPYAAQVRLDTFWDSQNLSASSGSSWRNEWAAKNYRATFEELQKIEEELGDLKGREELAHVLGTLHLLLPEGDKTEAIQNLALAGNTPEIRAFLIEAYWENNQQEEARRLFLQDKTVPIIPSLRSKLEQ